jgi:cobaltochelatase CobS
MSESLSELESTIGPRGKLSVNSDNRGMVRRWLVARGLPALFCGGLSMKEIAFAYNDTSDETFRRVERKAQEAIAEAAGADGGTMRAAESSGAAVANVSTQAAESSGPAIPADRAAKADQAMRLLSDLMESKGAGAIDADAIRAIVREELGASGTTRITVQNRTGKILNLDGVHHPEFATLCRMASAFGPDGYVPNILLAGEASSGKTTACKNLAKALGLRWYFNGAISMAHEMLGFIDAAGTYHRTPFRDAYEHGGVYTFDEMDRCGDPGALLAVNPHLAGSVGVFPDAQIQKHPDCIIIGTANTWGDGADAQYSGATKLDAAFLSRFPNRIVWNICEKTERLIVGNDPWTRKVQAARAKARAAGLKTLIDVRISQAGAALIAAGFTEKEAAERTYLAKLNDAQRKMIEA